MKQLSKEKRIEIRFKIQANLGSEDKHPDEVIKDDFNGDENAYFLCMAKWLEIEI